MVLSDSTHGDLTHFELILVQIEDVEGSKGVGYTYTVGSGGEAARVLVEHYLKPLLLGQDPFLIEKLWERNGGDFITEDVEVRSPLPFPQWTLPCRTLQAARFRCRFGNFFGVMTRSFYATRLESIFSSPRSFAETG